MAATAPQIHRSYQVEKLTSSNYMIWAVKMEALLVRSGIWQYVSGENPCPPPIVPIGAPVNTPPTNQAAIQDWHLNDSR
eukprot:c18786_g1_i1 orf=1-234(-)